MISRLNITYDPALIEKGNFDYFEFETTRGMVTGYDLRMCSEPLVYAPTKEKYKQLSQLFFAQDMKNMRFRLLSFTHRDI